MCSTEQRIAEIGRAIDELAVRAGMPADGEAPADGVMLADGEVPADGEAPENTGNAAVATQADDSSRIVARLAELWALLAELDPEVARRLAGYQALLSSADTPATLTANSTDGRLGRLVRTSRPSAWTSLSTRTS